MPAYRVRFLRPPPSALPLNIVLTGASIWSNTPDGGTDVAVKLQTLLRAAWTGNQATLPIVSIATTGGATFTGAGGSTSIVPQIAADVDPLWQNPNVYQNRIYTGSGCELNEINDFSGTASSTRASAASYITSAKGNHAWNVRIASCIATTEFPALQSIRDGYNTLIAADFAGGDGYINLISVAELQDASNTTYFYDGIHLKDAGRQKVADFMATLS